MQIRWSNRSIAEFDAIIAYIATDNESAAVRMAHTIVAAVRQLESFPKSGHPVGLGRTRVLPIAGTAYVVHYRIRHQIINLTDIVHGAKQHPDRT